MHKTISSILHSQSRPIARGRSIAFVADIYDTIFTSTLTTTTATAAKLLSVAVAAAAAATAAAKLLLPFKRALPTVVSRGQSIRLRLSGRRARARFPFSACLSAFRRPITTE